jgi:hypothetical protein
LSNIATIASLADFGRVISCGIRVVISTAATTLRGSLGGVLVAHTTFSAMAGKRYSDYTALPGYVPFQATTDGNIGGEVSYRPVDTADFTFNAATAGSTNWSTSTLTSQVLIIVGTGWVANSFKMEFSLVEHLETLGTLDAANMDEGGGAVADTTTMEQLGRKISNAPSPIKSSILQFLSHGLKNARGAVRGMGPFLQTNTVDTMLARLIKVKATQDACKPAADGSSSSGSTAGPERDLPVYYTATPVTIYKAGESISSPPTLEVTDLPIALFTSTAASHSSNIAGGSTHLENPSHTTCSCGVSGPRNILRIGTAMSGQTNCVACRPTEIRISESMTPPVMVGRVD